ncbi:MAG: tetratricopeptide repeat protein, partial [Nitrospinota bacterium]|nr:tetratricopeptide repeat protein [Nitrospinota bacterium]
MRRLWILLPLLAWTIASPATADNEPVITAEQIITTCVQKGEVPCAVGVDNRTINIDKRTYNVDNKLLNELLDAAKKLDEKEKTRFEELLGSALSIIDRMDRLEIQNNEIIALLKEKKEAGHVKQVDGKEAIDLSPEEMEKLIRVEKGIDTAYEDWLKVKQNVGSDRLLELLLANSKALREAGKYYEAQKRAEQAYQMDPANFDTLNQLGRCLKEIGEYEKAERKLRDAIDAANTDPDKSAALNNLAGVLRDQGKYDEVEKLYRESLDIDRKAYAEGHPHIAIGLNNLAGVLQDQGKYDEAEKLFREALAID